MNHFKNIWHRFLHVEQQTVEKVEEIFQLFASLCYSRRLENMESRWRKGRSGKSFLYDNSGKTLSLFFDDNITGEELDIVNPCEISGQNIPPKDLKERLMFQVDTKQALLDDNYYTNLVLSAL